MDSCKMSRVNMPPNHNASGHNNPFMRYSAFALGLMSLDKSLHMRLKTSLAMLFNRSVHTSHMWSDLLSDMR